MKQSFVFLSMLLMISACFFEEDGKEDNVVLLEDVLYLSSDQLRILGRIYSAVGAIEDHGFYISVNEDFEDVQIHSLGPRQELGLFLSDIKPLNEETGYFYKAFILSGGEIVFSEVGYITTYKTSIIGLDPHYGNEGDIIAIDGINLRDDLSYFIGDLEAEVVKRISDFRTLVKVPAHGDEFRVNVRGVAEGIELDGGKFDYITGRWTLMQSYGVIRKENLVFENETEIILGFGITASRSLQRNFVFINKTDFSYRVEPINSEELPRAVRGGFFTESGYFGGGAYGRNIISLTEYQWILSNEFWKYENGDFVNLGNLDSTYPDSVHAFSPAAFEINGALYVAGGERSYEVNGRYEQLPVRNMFKYDGGWELINTLPFEFSSFLLNTTVNGKEWFLARSKKFWEYDPKTNAFSELPIDFTGNVLDHGWLVQSDNLIYFGLFQFYGDFWELNTETLKIKPMNNFPGKTSYVNVASFSRNGNVFFLRSPNSSANDPKMELWMLEPNEFGD